jgi:hypothetical protein
MDPSQEERTTVGIVHVYDGKFECGGKVGQRQDAAEHRLVARGIRCRGGFSLSLLSKRSVHASE